MSAWKERACTAHNLPPMEAELAEGMGSLVYRVLRCPVCNRPQGMRLIRKADRK